MRWHGRLGAATLLLAVVIPVGLFWLAAAQFGWAWLHPEPVLAPPPGFVAMGPIPSTPPPPPDAPPRHPPADRDPGPGYEWVRGHQHGSRWVLGYWRRRPGYQPALPPPSPAAVSPAQ